MVKAKCLINIAMFSGCIIIVNVIDWNWNIGSRYNGKIDTTPLHSYLPRYKFLSKSIILKEEIGKYQLPRDFDRTENAESALSKYLRYLRNYTFTT